MPWARIFCPFRAYWVISTVQVERLLCRSHTRCWVGKTTWTTFITSYNSFGKPWAELSLLKLCHGEKECHEMEQLREDHVATAFPAKGNLVVKYCKCCICCLFLIFLSCPLLLSYPPSFGWFFFLCEKRLGMLRALPWNILLVLNSGIYFFLLSCSRNWPLGQSY